MTARPLLLALLGALAVGFLIERLIVTDIEAIENLVADAESAFNEGRLGDLVDILDPEFRYGTRNRDETIAHLERLAKQFQAAGIVVVLDAPRIDGDEATANGRVRLRVLSQLSVVPVSLRFVRGEGGWLFKGAALGSRDP